MESPASLRHSPRTAKHSTVQQPLENNSSTVAMELRSPRTGIWRKSGTSSTSANIHTSDAPSKSAMAKSPKSPLAPLKATVAISQSEEAHSRAFNAQSDQQYQQQQHQLRQRHRSASSERPERANSRQRPFITRPLINTDIDTLVPPPEVVTTATQNKQQQTSASTEKSLLEVEVEVDIDALFDSDVSSPPPSWYANTGDGTSVSALGDDAALDDDLRQMQLPFDDIMMAKLRRSVAKKLKADHEDMLGGINITGGMNNAVSNAGNGGDKKRLKIGAGGNGRSLPPRIGDPAEYNPQSNNEDLSSLRKRRPREEEEEEEAPANNDFCDACHQSGEFVCCEGCPRSFHFDCAEPPFDPYAPQNQDVSWFCNLCTRRRQPTKTASTASNTGLFGELMEQLNAMNPTVFSLPEEVKFYFKGVACDPTDGSYVDLQETRANNTSGRRPVEETAVCQRCGKGPSRLQQLLLCDSCPLAWHLDCLTPPLVTAPPPNKKWQCPAHATGFKKRRVAANQPSRVIEITDPAIPNGGDVDVQLDDNSVFIQHKAIIPTYRIPEHSIRFNFMRRFGTLGQLAREQYKEEELHSSGNTSSGGDDGRVRIPSQLKHFYGPITRQTRRSPASNQQHSSVSTQQQQQHYQPPDDEQSRLWLTCLSRFYDEIYHYSIAKQQQQPLTGTVEQAESPQNPFESINDLDYLYRVALGQLPQHTSAASHPIADYTQDPLFTQFMAWKQLNIVQRKHDSISQHLYSNQSAADNNSNRRQSPRSNKNRSPTHNK